VKTFNYKNALGLLLIVAALSTACDNEYGLFASIQEEVEQTSSKIFTDAAVGDVARFGTSYYARLNHLYSRPVSGGDWTETSPAAFGSNYDCTAMAVFGPKLYVALRDSDSGAARGVYALSGGTWSAVAGFNSLIVEAFYPTATFLFASVNDSGNHILYQCDTGDSVSMVPDNSPFVANTEMITGVVYNGSIYLASKGNTVYSDVFGTPTAVSATDSAINGLTANGATVYAARDNGTALYSTAWTTAQPVNDDPLTAISYIPGWNGVVMGVGNGGTGYYETTTFPSGITEGSSGALATSTNYETTLKDKAIVKFYWDGTDTLFACTASGSTGESALWSNKYTTSWSGWTAE